MKMLLSRTSISSYSLRRYNEGLCPMVHIAFPIDLQVLVVFVSLDIIERALVLVLLLVF